MGLGFARNSILCIAFGVLTGIGLAATPEQSKCYVTRGLVDIARWHLGACGTGDRLRRVTWGVE